MEKLKILILGCSGSGKSTLTRELEQLLKIPILHLDRIWHTTNYDDEAQKFLRKTQIDFMTENESFIVDGNYTSSMDIRMPHANFIIWFRIPRYLCLYRVISRSIKQKLKLETRSDMADEFQEKFDREYIKFLKFIWHFEKNHTPKIEELLKQRKPNCQVVLVRNKKDKTQLLKEFKATSSPF